MREKHDNGVWIGVWSNYGGEVCFSGYQRWDMDYYRKYYEVPAPQYRINHGGVEVEFYVDRFGRHMGVSYPEEKKFPFDHWLPYIPHVFSVEAHIPAPDEIRAARNNAGLSQSAAAEKIHSTLRTWQDWEAGKARMHPGLWELFRIKSAS
jgi:putative transcriptional regulator